MNVEYVVETRMRRSPFIFSGHLTREPDMNQSSVRTNGTAYSTAQAQTGSYVSYTWRKEEGGEGIWKNEVKWTSKVEMKKASKGYPLTAGVSSEADQGALHSASATRMTVFVH